MGKMEIPASCKGAWRTYFGDPLPASWVIALADPATGSCQIKQFDYNNERRTNANLMDDNKGYGSVVLECPYWLAYNAPTIEVATSRPTP